MHIITEKGEIVEGQALTNYEADLIPLLISEFREKSPSYIEMRSAQVIVAHLIANYKITPRNRPQVEPTPETVEVAAAQEVK